MGQYLCVGRQTREDIPSDKAPLTSPDKKVSKGIKEKKNKEGAAQFKRSASARSYTKLTRNKLRSTGSKSREPREMNKNKICIASWEREYLRSVEGCIKNIVQTTESIHDIEVVATEIEDRNNKKRESWFQNAQMVILLAKADQRLLLLSDSEHGLIDAPYRTAIKNKVNLLVILVGHAKSESSEDLYALSLESLLSSQPMLQPLAKRGEFLSVGFVACPEELKFNDKQITAVTKWIERSRGTKVKQGDKKSEDIPVTLKDIKPKIECSLCVACEHKEFLNAIETKLKDLLATDLRTDKVKISSFLLSANDGKLPEVDMYVFAITATQRLLLISEKEPTYFGDIITKTEQKKTQGCIFIMLLGHSESDNLEEGELYFSNFKDTLFASQPRVKIFADLHQFLSTGSAFSPEDIQFNEIQKKCIFKWVKRTVQQQHIPEPCTEEN